MYEKKPCFLVPFQAQRTVVLARRCRRYRHALPLRYYSATPQSFLPPGLEPLGFSPVGQLRVAS